MNASASAGSAPAAIPRALALWLFAVAAMIFVMVVIGGLTRLTESGLSITEWQPIMGALPPFSERDWLALYEKYQRSPQFQKIFPNLTLDGFKGIFWLEYIHRLWGRLIGLAYALPFFWFLLRRRIPRPLILPLWILLILGGLQGALGWYMVASGLVDRPSVSHYRLAAHLGLAIALYAGVLWIALGAVRRRERESAAPRALRLFAAILVAATILFGAFVAGLDAGLIYNTFPLMGGQWWPADYWDARDGLASLVEHKPAVQFNHRLLATLTLAAVAWMWWRTLRGDGEPKRRNAATALLLAVLLQYGLGIATLLAFVPVWLGTLHQAGAMIVVTALVWQFHAARLPVSPAR
jgi:cytochrome c oxidase assembly protein subunit 15